MMQEKTFISPDNFRFEVTSTRNGTAWRVTQYDNGSGAQINTWVVNSYYSALKLAKELAE